MTWDRAFLLLIGGMWGLLIPSIIYAYHSDLRNIRGQIKELDEEHKSTRKRVHDMSGILQDHGEALARHEEHRDHVKDMLDEIKATMRDMSAKLDRALDLRSPPSNRD